MCPKWDTWRDRATLFVRRFNFSIVVLVVSTLAWGKGSSGSDEAKCFPVAHVERITIVNPANSICEHHRSILPFVGVDPREANWSICRATWCDGTRNGLRENVSPLRFVGTYVSTNSESFLDVSNAGIVFAKAFIIRWIGRLHPYILGNRAPVILNEYLLPKYANVAFGGKEPFGAFRHGGCLILERFQFKPRPFVSSEENSGIISGIGGRFSRTLSGNSLLPDFPIGLIHRIPLLIGEPGIDSGSSEGKPCTDRKPYLYPVVLALVSAVVSFASFAYILFGSKGEKLFLFMFLLQLVCFVGIAYGTYQFLNVWSQCNRRSDTTVWSS